MHDGHAATRCEASLKSVVRCLVDKAVEIATGASAQFRQIILAAEPGAGRLSGKITSRVVLHLLTPIRR
jgi:hypothetical protein